MTDYPFHKVAVYDQLGGVVRLARNSRIDVTDPATGLVAAGLKVSGLAVSFVTTDALGQADFTSTLGTVDITSPNGLTERIISSVVLEAAAGAGVSSDAAVAALLSNPASASRAAGDAVYAPASDALVYASKNGVAVGNTAAANTTALNALHTSALALGAEIVLPPGNIAVNTLTVKASMRGAGKSKTTLVAADTITVNQSNVTMASLGVKSANQTAIIAANLTDLTLRDVFVDYDAAVTTNWLAVNPFNIDRLRVLNCRFRIGGIQLSGCDDFLIDGNYWDCEYVNTNEPCHISGQSSGQFVNNTVYRTLTDGVDLYSSGHWCVVANNRFIGLKGGAGIECKVTMSDDVGNTSAPGNVFEGTIIANNVLKDFVPPSTGTRAGIYAEYVDTRAVPAFSVAETNRGIVISGNVLQDFNVADPGGSVVGSYWGIAYTGHNGLISDNTIRTMRAWTGAVPVGIKIAAPTTSKAVGLRVTNNVIAGVENNFGIEAGSMDRCAIDGNTIRQDEVTSLTPRYGVSVATGGQWNDCSISNNVFESTHATGKAINSSNSANLLTRCRIENNTIKGCGVGIATAQSCSFIGNTMDSGANNQLFAVGLSGTSSRLNIFSGNHITMATEYAFSLTDQDGFVITGNTFRQTKRAILLNGGTRNGVIDNNVSLTQTLGTEFPHYSGVSAPDQATISVGTNKVL